MSSISEVSFLKLLSEESKILPDVTFKFEDSEETLVAHKQVLAQMSTVFEGQFYGPMSAHARAEGYLSSEMEYITEKEFHYETFYIFIRHLYGDKVILKNCSSYSTLFQLLNMAKLYLIDKLGELVNQRIVNLKVSMEILLASLETALAYRNLEGFKEICEKVTKEIVSTFSALPNAAQFRFYKEQRQDNPELVAALINIMSARKLSENAEPDLQMFDLNQFYQFYHDQKDEHPEQVKVLIDLMSRFVKKASIGCTNCVMPPGLCKDGQPIEVVPHRGMRLKYENDDAIYQVEGVIPIVDDVEVDVDDEKDYLISMFYDGESPESGDWSYLEEIKDSTVRYFCKRVDT